MKIKNKRDNKNKMIIYPDGCRNAANELRGAFIWEQSKEGYAFWSNLTKRLDELAEYYKK